MPGPRRHPERCLPGGGTSQPGDGELRSPNSEFLERGQQIALQALAKQNAKQCALRDDFQMPGWYSCRSWSELGSE